MLDWYYLGKSPPNLRHKNWSEFAGLTRFECKIWGSLKCFWLPRVDSFINIMREKVLTWKSDCDLWHLARKTHFESFAHTQTLTRMFCLRSLFAFLLFLHNRRCFRSIFRPLRSNKFYDLWTLEKSKNLFFSYQLLTDFSRAFKHLRLVGKMSKVKSFYAPTGSIIISRLLMEENQFAIFIIVMIWQKSLRGWMNFGFGFLI